MPTPESPRVAIYVRQSVGEDQGIRQQLDDCRAEARRRGWRVVAEYVDNDTSATKQRGVGTDWHRMLRDLDAGEFDTLLVTETSRLTRSLPDVLDVTPPRRDVRVVVIREGIDTQVDDFLLKQLVLLAEREVKLKKQRAERYARERRAAGHPTAGMTPHGYRWIPAIDRDADGTRYAIDEDEAADVRQMFREFLAGAPLGQIARDLNDAGRRTRKGARWGKPTVRRVLLNPAYAALLSPAQPTGQYDPTVIQIETCTPGAWAAIVDVDHFLAARSRLMSVKPHGAGSARRWLLSGLAMCSVCGTPVRSARGETHPTARKDGSRAPSARYHAYRCTRGHFMRNGDIVDTLVSEACIGRLAQPDAATLLAPPATGPDPAVLHAQRAELEGRRATIASLIASGRLSPKAAEEALDDLDAELRSINDQITRAVTSNPLADLAGVDDVRAWWEGATLARRRSIVEMLMRVWIQPVGSGRRVTTLKTAAETVDIDWIQARRSRAQCP